MKTKYLVLSLLLRNSSFFLLFFIFSSLYCIADIEINLLSDSKLTIGEANHLVYEIKNNQSKVLEIFLELELPETFKIISEENQITLNKNEKKVVLNSILISEATFAKDYSVKIQIKDFQNKILATKYITLSVLPKQNLVFSCIDQPDFLLCNKNSKVMFLVENKGNLPVLYTVDGLKSELIKPNLLYPNQSNRIETNINPSDQCGGYYPLNLKVHTTTINADTLIENEMKYYYYFPIYKLYENNYENYYKLPVKLSNKYSYNSETKDYNHDLISFGYTNLNERNPVIINWYFKKHNSNYLNQWNDEDEYTLSIQSRNINLLSGKLNYNQSPLLNPVFGEGFDISMMSHQFIYGQSVVKSLYKDRAGIISHRLGYSFSSKENFLNYNRNSLIFSYITKNSNYPINNIFSNKNDSSLNDKITLNYHYDTNFPLKLNSSFLLTKLNARQWDKRINSYHNDFMLKLPDFSLYFNTIYQPKTIKEEYNYHKQFESGFLYNSSRNFFFNSGVKYQSIKTDYSWSFNYKKLNKSCFATTDLKFYRDIFGTIDFTYSKIDGDSRSFNSSDYTLYSGIKVKKSTFQSEFLYGNRRYNYFSKVEQNHIGKVNIRYDINQNIQINSINTVTIGEDFYDLNNYFYIEIPVKSSITQALFFEIQNYSDNYWQNKNKIGLETRINYKNHILIFKNDYSHMPNARTKSVYETSLEYSLPLSIPIYPKSKKREVSISLHDPYLKKPVQGALFKLNDYYALTDERGNCQWTNLNQRAYNIQLLNQPKGFIVEPTLPDTIRFDEGKKIALNYQLRKPGRVIINIKEVNPIPIQKVIEGENIYLFGKEIVKIEEGKPDRCRELVLCLKKQNEVVYKKPDSKGKIIFENCSTGLAEIMIQSESIPENYKVDKQSILLEIKENIDTEISIILEPSLIKIGAE